MDVVYSVRTGSNDELRYSLRSIAANLPHDRVWIAGHAEPWLANVGEIRVPQVAPRHEQARRNWLAAIEHPLVSDPFVYMNDDFYVVEPIDQVPVLHRGTLDEHAAGRVNGSSYQMAIHRTRQMLAGMCVCTIDTRDGSLVGREDGCPAHPACEDGPLSYDLHVPMVVAKTGFRSALERCATDARLLPRSIYGNVAGLAGVYSPSVKSADAIAPGPFLSSSDATWETGRLGKHVRSLFPALCRYEAS